MKTNDDSSWVPYWGVPQMTVVVFVGLWFLAMWLYPGGNSFDPQRVGHDFVRNFLCDVLSMETAAGRSNRLGALAMNVGILVLVLGGLLPLWWRVPFRNPWRAMSRSFGGLAAILTLTICVEQFFALTISHHLVTLAAGAAGLIPTILAAIGDWRGPETSPLRRWLLAGTILAALVNFVSYSMVQAGWRLTPVVPTAQKAALICLLAWLFLKVPSRADRVSP